MPKFDSSGVTINYISEGEGKPIVLVHGFASDLHGNWRATGIVDRLVADGRRVVALDCRGHGRSDKPHEPAAYSGSHMADDVIALMDHLGIAKADLMGYSMGGFIATTLLVDHPERFRSVILGGVGDGVLLGGRLSQDTNAIADALEADDPERITDATARGFRAFADSSGADRLALAALQRSDRHRYDPARLADVAVPVLVLVGEKDVLVGRGEKLAAAIPGARHVVVPGDHLGAPTVPAYADTVIAFLGQN